MLEELGHGVAQGLDAIVDAHERDLRHRGAQHAGSDRVALGMVGIKEAFRRCPVDHLAKLPAQVHRILHAGVEALSTDRGVHVRRVARQQDAPRAVGRSLPGHIGEPGDRCGTVDPVVGPVDGDERLAEIAQGGFGRRSDVRLGQHDPHRPSFLVDHFAVADLVVDLAQGMHARGSRGGCPTQAPRSSRPGRSARSWSDPNRGTRCRLPCGPDCVLRRTRRDSRARSDRPSDRATSTPVSSCASPVTSRSAVDRHRQLADPAGQNALDVVLPQPEPVGVTGGKVADVQRGAGEPCDLGHLSLRQEPIGDSALIENLDGA